MKIKKYILSLLIGATALSFSSCNDFLDRDPLGQFTEDDAPNALVGGKIFNVYYLMRSYDITAGIPAFMVHMVRSEDSEKGSDAGDGGNEAAMWDDFEYTASIGPLAAYWGQNYKIIYQCNEILDDIANSDHKDDTESIRNRGEALFFRAYCYFNLVRAFGEVPLVTIKVVEASDANVPKTTAEKIYEQIDKDLTEAEKCLPLRWDSDYTGRLTWGAARSLHARTYMMRNDWENMYTASTDVVNSGIYNLNTPVDKVFTVEGENCGESIFELQCESTDAMKEDGSIGSQFCQVQGVRGAGNWDLGWGWHMATTLMGKAYEPGDPRKNATLLYFRHSDDEPITEENTNLGFAYNLLGMKPLGIVICIILIVFDALVMIASHCKDLTVDITLVLFCIIFTLLYLIIWFGVINKKLVKNCAKKYAFALLSACDSELLNK